MGNVEQNQQRLEMISLFPVSDQLKPINSVTEANIMALISAVITEFETKKPTVS